MFEYGVLDCDWTELDKSSVISNPPAQSTVRSISAAVPKRQSARLVQAWKSHSLFFLDFTHMSSHVHVYSLYPP